MKVDMAYGKSKFTADIKDKNVLSVVQSNDFKSKGTEDEVIDYALKHPISSARLKELVHPGETVCIVISDVTRAWQRMDKYLYKIVEELNDGGVKDEDITFLSATGTHRKQTDEEHKKLLGEKLCKRFKVIDHDCRDKDSLVYLGTTTHGTPVIVNKKAVECDHVVITGAIIYHFLVGWSGGRKSILPGISSYETIMANHGLSLSDKIGAGTYPSIRSANIVNNPVHDDMLQAASFIRPTFMFNVIMKDGKIVDAVSGNYLDAHAKGRQIVDSIDGVKLKERADMSIASAGGYPKDINLYQSIKTLMNARTAIKEGGTIIMISRCNEGIGGDKDLQDIVLNYDSLLDRERNLRERYSISKYVGYYFCETAAKCNFILVADIDPNLLKRAGIKVVKTLDEALKIAYDGKKADDMKVYLMPHGANTLPKFEE